MPFTPVTENQFEISDQGIKHLPTGCEWTPHPGSPFSGSRREGYRGSKLPDGRDFAIDDLDRMMQRLWAQHVKKCGLDKAIDAYAVR